MALKIIGAGFGRTGTLSLKIALEQLGFDKCYHMIEVIQHDTHPDMWCRAHQGETIDWDALFTGYQAVVDWPACNLWREIAAHYPSAPIVLTLRDPELWYKSVMNTIYPSCVQAFESDDEATAARGRWLFELIWEPVFDGRMDDKDHVISRFNAHNQAVIEEVPPERLLVYEPGQGWESLCEFLQVPVPDKDYPKVNTTDQFWSLLKKFRNKSKQ